MHPNREEILAGVGRLVVAAGGNVSQVTSLTAAAELLPELARAQEAEVATLEQQAAGFPARIAAAKDLAGRARQLLHGVEDANRRLIADHRQANATALADVQHRLEMAQSERGRCQQGLFPQTGWREAQAQRESPTATRWQELEEVLIPQLEQELAALEPPLF